MIGKIKKTISIYDMFSEGDKVLVGLSGGPDSVCLLHVLVKLAPAYKLKIFAAHLNHGYRGKESDGDEVFCRKLCGDLGVPFFSKKVNPVRSSGRVRPRPTSNGVKIKMSEDEARKARYSFFEEVAREVGVDKIALGHNADDEAETVLMRLLRGAGARGLAGILPARRHGKFFIVRPLINVWKSEILDYLKGRKTKYREDSSNKKMDFFRNKIRHELIPFLRKYNPNIKNVLLNLGKNMAMTNEFLQNVVEKEYSKSAGFKLSRNKLRGSKKQLERGKSRGIYPVLELRMRSSSIKISCLKKMPQIVCQEFIRRAAQDFEPKLSLTADHVNSILALIGDEKGSKESCLPCNVKVVKEYDNLVFDKNMANKDYKVGFVVPGKVKIPFHNILIASELCKKTDKKTRNFFEVKMDYDKMLRPLGVRNRRHGDVFQPIGFGHKKKLKDIFIDEKIPKRVRDFLPLIVSGKDICWIPGYRIGERFKIGPETKRVVRIKVEGLEGVLES